MFFLTLTALFREVLYFPCSHCIRDCVSFVLWCVLQLRILKQSKIPVGVETQVQSAGGMTTVDSLCLCLFFLPHFSLSCSFFPSLYFCCFTFCFSFPLFFLWGHFPYHKMYSSATAYFSSIPSFTLFSRVNAVLSQCRCGFTSCVGSVATCGQPFLQIWPRRCSVRCCQRLCSCWCRDIARLVLHIKDTYNSGTLLCICRIQAVYSLVIWCYFQ